MVRCARLSGQERRIRDNILHRVSALGTKDIYEVQVPMEDAVIVRKGQRKMLARVRLPGYVFVRMNMNEESWAFVRQTPGITGFVGDSKNPKPLTLSEAFEMLKTLVKPIQEQSAQLQEIPATVDVGFEVGETITIKDGSFEGLDGTITKINIPSGKITVLVSIFGRDTPLELGVDQVIKL